MNGARYAYLNRICELVEQGHPIIIVSEDYAAPMFDSFRVKYPKHFLCSRHDFSVLLKPLALFVRPIPPDKIY